MPTNIAANNDLIITHIYLIQPIVSEFMARLPYQVNRDDLVSAATLGLVLAGRSFEENRGVPFARWAAFKIHAAINDELRAKDWASRSLRPRARAVEFSRNKLAIELGRMPTNSELAVELSITITELRNIEHDVYLARVVSSDNDSGEGIRTLIDFNADPQQLLDDKDGKTQIQIAISALPDRLRYLIRAKYYDDKPMIDIAGSFGVTDTRVSQLHAEAIKLLRIGLSALQEPIPVYRDRFGKHRGSTDRYLAAIDKIRVA